MDGEYFLKYSTYPFALLLSVPICILFPSFAMGTSHYKKKWGKVVNYASEFFDRIVGAIENVFHRGLRLGSFNLFPISFDIPTN